MHLNIFYSEFRGLSSGKESSTITGNWESSREHNLRPG